MSVDDPAMGIRGRRHCFDGGWRLDSIAWKKALLASRVKWIGAQVSCEASGIIKVEQP